MAEHFVRPPQWEWYILAYFFLGGLTGGLYALATMLRLWGSPRDEAAARAGFLWAFPLLVLCPIFLTIDLGRPQWFWHMLIDTSGGGIAFKYWSPMSVGSWALLLYGIFSFVSFVEVLALEGRVRAPFARSLARGLAGGSGRVWNVIGTVFGLFVAGYTGVLLSVSNQPIWSDTSMLGGLFVASGLSGGAALLSWLSRGRPGAEASERRVLQADRYFAVLELALIVLVFVNLAAAGTAGRALGGAWGVVWVLVVLSLLPPLAGLGGPSLQVSSRSGGAAVAGSTAGLSRAAVATIVLLGVLLMRFAVIFSAQF